MESHQILFQSCKWKHLKGKLMLMTVYSVIYSTKYIMWERVKIENFIYMQTDKNLHKFNQVNEFCDQQPV